MKVSGHLSNLAELGCYLRPVNEPFDLKSPDERTIVRIDPSKGGRVGSLTIDGRELLVAETDDPLLWGCYPMVPFAGRIRDGILKFDDVTYHLPTTLGPHAMHGYGFTSSWERLDEATIGLPLCEPWPFEGHVTQRFELENRQFQLSMTVRATDRQPITVGWHPWFLRDTGRHGMAELELSATAMYLRDSEGMPSGALVPPPPGPWDDCFTKLVHPPKIRWGSFELHLSSSADHWVVYDEPDWAMCVEPQTGPPNEANDDPFVLEAGESSTTTFTLRW